MTDFAASERGVSIRNPSTANFLIDSQDRFNYPGATWSGNFLINKPQSLLNGFFTRIAPTEITLDWCVDNIATDASNNFLTFSVGATTYTATLPDGQYTVKLALDTLVVRMNALAIAGHTFLVSNIGVDVPGKVSLADSNPTGFTVLSSPLQRLLDLKLPSSPQQTYPVNCPNLQRYTYIDFISPQLTYNQDLKDATTANDTRDVLFRWNFADTVPNSLDAYGYPILQGYGPFVQLRPIAFPKQIKWDARQPIGQVAFQVYGSDGKIVPADVDFDWRMTLLVSEV